MTRGIATLLILAAAAAIAALGAYAGYQAALAYVPWKLMRYTYGKWTPPNQWHHADAEAGEKTWVKIANPDFIISRASYDLGEGPLRFTGPLPERVYWSLTFYADNSVNVFIANDEDFETDRYDVILVRKGEAEAARARFPGARVAESPSRMGYAVVRLLIDRENPYEMTKEVQTAAAIAVCGPGPDGC